MRLNQAQQEILFAIEADEGALKDFDVLCAEFEAALDETERPEDAEKTDPFGVAALRPDTDTPRVEPVEAAMVVAIAWLEMIATAIVEQDSEISPNLFDEDGVALFTDTRGLYEVARRCGFGPAHARRAFARVRRDSKIAPPRALRILTAIRAISVPKRKTKFRGLSRVKPLDERFAFGLDKREIARAKAGSIFYSLVAEGGTYVFRRTRKLALGGGRGPSYGDLDVISAGKTEEAGDFVSPFIPCPEAQQLAVDHFVSYLDGKGLTYQRVVYLKAIA